METNLIVASAFAGFLLAIIEGIKPGPLLTMVIRETLSGDLRSGLWTASAPIFTDGPLIIVSFLFASLIADNPGILVFISILGAAFMFKMGVECFNIEPPSVAILLEPISSRKAFGRGVLTNLLNPNVYIFWFLIGGPIMAASVEAEPLAPIAYAVSFILCIILVKCGVALAIYRLRDGMPIHIYRAVLTACGFAMILFAVGYLGFAWTQIQAM
jgi:threonine/homoserine/homoserine lactone efflux protein